MLNDHGGRVIEDVGIPNYCLSVFQPKNKALLSISLSEQVTPVSEEADTVRTLIFPSLVVVGKVLTITHICLVRESNNYVDVSPVVETTTLPVG